MQLSSFLLFPLFLCVAFSLSQDAFSPTLQYDQLILSYAAYCPADQIMNWSCFFCNNNSDVSAFKPVATVYNASTDIFGYVGYTGSIAQVIFRGTHVSSLQNWVDGAFVHSGFYQSWLSVKSQVLTGLKLLESKITPTEYYFSGHSLGAAVSVLAAVDIGPSLNLPVTCYNYGDPRVGNNVFASYFNAHIDTTYRIVNQHDIVPHLPTKELGFWHISTEVWWNTSTTYKVCDETGEDPTCSDSILVSLNIEEHLSYLGIPLRLGHPSGCM